MSILHPKVVTIFSIPLPHHTARCPHVRPQISNAHILSPLTSIWTPPRLSHTALPHHYLPARTPLMSSNDEPAPGSTQVEQGTIRPSFGCARRARSALRGQPGPGCDSTGFVPRSPPPTPSFPLRQPARVGWWGVEGCQGCALSPGRPVARPHPPPPTRSRVGTGIGGAHGPLGTGPLRSPGRTVQATGGQATG
jgi:hypothetical protein